MSASIPSPNTQLKPAEEAEVLRLVDRLAAGECTTEDFLLSVHQLEQVNPDAGWEVLALVDQYFRRKKISPALFVSLKKQLGQRNLAEDKAPSLPPTPTPVLAPSPAPAPATASGNTQPAWRAGILIRGRYRITEVLRRTPSETLVEAVDEVRAELPGVRQRVAIHVLEAAGAQQSALLQRLCRLQALSHPCIVRVFDVDAEPGVLYLTRELLNGRSLQTLVEQCQQRLDQSVAQMILGSVASALAHAHSQDVFHGDIRAENVFIADVGEVRLTGFELQSKGAGPSAAADLQAFARLACELLSGAPVPRARLPGDPAPGLQAPPGVNREQWRELQDILAGRNRGRAGHVLTLFGRNSSAETGQVAVLRMGATPPPPGNPAGKSSWIAAGLVVCLLAAAAYLISTHDAGSVPAEAAALPAAEAPAAVPVAPPVVPDIVARPEPTPAVVPQPEFQRALLDLPTRIAQVDGQLPVARIWVRRQGGLREEVTFLWWTESGTAEVDTDFREIAPRMATVASGARGVELLVPLVPNAERQSPRAFYVKIDSPGPGARLGERNLTQVMIMPPVSGGFAPQ